jgi:hypothetical protein
MQSGILMNNVISCSCVDATEVYMVLYQWGRRRIVTFEEPFEEPFEELFMESLESRRRAVVSTNIRDPTAPIISDTT